MEGTRSGKVDPRFSRSTVRSSKLPVQDVYSRQSELPYSETTTSLTSASTVDRKRQSNAMGQLAPGGARRATSEKITTGMKADTNNANSRHTTNGILSTSSDIRSTTSRQRASATRSYNAKREMASQQSKRSSQSASNSLYGKLNSVLSGKHASSSEEKKSNAERGSERDEASAKPSVHTRNTPFSVHEKQETPRDDALLVHGAVATKDIGEAGPSANKLSATRGSAEENVPMLYTQAASDRQMQAGNNASTKADSAVAAPNVRISNTVAPNERNTFRAPSAPSPLRERVSTAFSHLRSDFSQTLQKSKDTRGRLHRLREQHDLEGQVKNLFLLFAKFSSCKGE
jgi:hypothetical protein